VVCEKSNGLHRYQPSWSCAGLRGLWAVAGGGYVVSYVYKSTLTCPTRAAVGCLVGPAFPGPVLALLAPRVSALPNLRGTSGINGPSG
jgi:hypothetical protein